MDIIKLNEILTKHKLWLNGEDGGERADLRNADLSGADLRGADLKGADLSGADLRGAYLRSAYLSSAIGLISQWEFVKDNFETTADGIIAYKTFNSVYSPPNEWKIEKGSVITENVNFDRCEDCGCGINVAPFERVEKNINGDIWKVIIRWEWLAGICVPYSSNGKIRCECCELLEIVKECSYA